MKPLLDQAIESQESQTISLIQKAIQEYSSKTFQPDKVLREAQSLDAQIQALEFSFRTGALVSPEEQQILTLHIKTNRPLLIAKKRSIEEWIRTRIQQPEVVIIWKEDTTEQ